MKDVSLNIRCESNNTIIVGGAWSYTKMIQDLIVTCCKGRPLCQRKQKQFKKSKYKPNNASSNITVEVILLHQSNLN